MTRLRTRHSGTLLIVVSFLAACSGTHGSSGDGGNVGDGARDGAANSDGHGDGANSTGDGRTDGNNTTGDGSHPDVMTGCFGRTCDSLHVNCGPVSDGCGGLLQCGTCSGTQSCGGGGTPSVCGTPATTTCTPRTCGATDCGPIADGCGTLVTCPGCASPMSCGGGGVPSRCGVPSAPDGGTGGCHPRTCTDAHASCGPAGDGCGALLDCGPCVAPMTCGGAGVLSQCGMPASTGTCTNLCLRQMTCAGGATTTLSGTVFAPNGGDPLYNALVYIPNAPVAAFTPGVACDQCGAPASGSPLVSATTGPDGQFTLSNVPVGANIPLVIQLGRWRRQVVIPNVSPCTSNTVAASLTHLPRNHTQGDIPRMAMVTGNVDTLECVLRKIGLDDAEFSTPTGNGRVQFYIGNGSDIGAGAPPMSTLTQNATTLASYDMLLFSCMGSPVDQTAADQQLLINYASAGGRVFATHYSYTWLYNDVPFSDTATWNVHQGNPPNPETATVDTSFARGAAFAQWLVNVGASTTLGQVDIQEARHDFDGVAPASQRWLYTSHTRRGVTTDTPLHYTFNTPVGAAPAQQCGRVLFSDFHVANATNSGTLTFPAECDTGALTAQEKILEFMIFDLSSCVPTTMHMGSCSPTTCTAQNVTCGPIGDGCGGSLNCGTCDAPDTCGGGGVLGACGHVGCAPQTCEQAGASCGQIGDGCGSSIDCGPCVAPDTCGGGGTPSVCGHAGCTPQTCAGVGATCGQIGDGCGSSVNCGACHAPDTCGGGGLPNQCGNIG